MPLDTSDPTDNGGITYRGWLEQRLFLTLRDGHAISGADERQFRRLYGDHAFVTTRARLALEVAAVTA